MTDEGQAKPLLAVDVDGVISLFGFDEPPTVEELRFEEVDGVTHCVAVAAGDRLRELAEHYDLFWATGWERRANNLSPVLGLSELPYLTFAGAARFGSAEWKIAPLDEYAGERPLAWVDDSFDALCYEWARAREAPTLLIPTESHLGLGDVQVEALIAWARGFDSSPPTGVEKG